MRHLKLIFLAKGIYREVSLSELETNEILVGNYKGCGIRFGPKMYFEEFGVALKRENESWYLSSEKNCVMTQGLRKLQSEIPITYGDEFVVKSLAHSNLEILKIQVLHDVDYTKQNYEKVFYLNAGQKIHLGGTEACQIRINDPLLANESYALEYISGNAVLSVIQAKYGVSINGVKQSLGSFERIPIKNHDFIELVDYFFYYLDGKLYGSKEVEYLLSEVKSELILESSTGYTYPKFNRSTRLKYILPEEEIEILAPKSLNKPPRKKLLMTLIPALIMLAVTIVLRGFMGSGGTFIIFSAISMTMGILISITTYVSDKKQYKKDAYERKEKYFEYVSKKESEIKALREKELDIRNYSYLLPKTLVALVGDFDSRLFERTLDDEDFLTLTIGKGTVVSNCPITYNRIEYKDVDDPLMDIPEEIANRYKWLTDAPVTVSLKEAGCIGIFGNTNGIAEILKVMTLDLAVRQFYKELKLCYIADDDLKSALDGVKWLPHAQNETMGIRNIANDAESKNVIIEYLYTLLTERSQVEDSKRMFDEQIVVFVKDLESVINHPVSKYFSKGRELGVFFVFISDLKEFLPQNCKYLIEMNEGHDGYVIDSEDAREKALFTHETVTSDTLVKVAEKLSAVEVAEVSLESELKQSISFFELFNIMAPEDLDVYKNWTTSEVYKSLSVPLGVRRGDEVVTLDLNEKFHGPHGLVAGTTGSGKSEILQSYIMAMAVTYHPHDVAFMIIDFKGGGMANQFEKLPHLLGTITNIDGREINRSLKSIKAELRKRQEMLTAYDVNHVDAYIRLSKQNSDMQKMPHLIIIVDEFAELKAEYPDFMKELISAARIGRSLGVHLILATQKPAGVVDNQIWSNSKFKLCLKVQTKEDSNEVLKNPLAAEIVQPGRAYLQVGNNEIFELFQSAFSGAPVDEFLDEKIQEFSLLKLNHWGKRELLYTNKAAKKETQGETQLDAMVDYVSERCSAFDIGKLKGICLPSLPDYLTYDALPMVLNRTEGEVISPIGVYDDPDRQIQEPLNWNYSAGNTFIIGASASGKTTLLQTMLFGILKNYAPSDVSLYLIDCGNKALSVFAKAPHVGGVVFPQEDEKCKNLFKLIGREIQERKEKFSASNVGSYKAYRALGHTDTSHLLLMIDNYPAFKEHYSDYEQNLLMISREGPGLGITLICTGNQANALGYKMLYNFNNRIALNCGESSEYGYLFDRCKVVPKELEGRGIIKIDKAILEFQVALSSGHTSEFERNNHFVQFAETLKNQYHPLRAKGIPQVPAILTAQDLEGQYPEAHKKEYQVVMGLDYANVALFKLNLLQLGQLVIMGQEKSGKSNVLSVLLNGIQKNVFRSLSEVYLFDGDDYALTSYQNLGIAKEYYQDLSQLEYFFEILEETLDRRDLLVSECTNAEEKEQVYKSMPLLMLVIENNAFIETVSKTPKYLNVYTRLTQGHKKYKTLVVFSNLPNSQVGFSGPEILKRLKEIKRAFILDDLSNQKFYDISLKQQKDQATPWKVSDGYFYDGEYEKIKLVFDEQEAMNGE